MLAARGYPGELRRDDRGGFDDLAEAVDACVSIVEADETFHRKDDEKRLVARDILDELRANP